MARSCGGCTACCKIMPVSEINKPALTRCPHQRTGKGCAIYAGRPLSCAVWSCVWLRDPEATADLSRPDRSHYVIDMIPDYITQRNDDTGEAQDWPVIQVWVSAAYPNAHRDPALRAYLAKRGEEGVMALIRIGSNDAFLLVPPAMNDQGIWFEQRSSVTPQREHDAADIAAVWRRELPK